MMRRNFLLPLFAFLVALYAAPAVAEYCFDMPPGTTAYTREYGSIRTRFCAANESGCVDNRKKYFNDRPLKCYFVPGAYPPTPVAKTSPGPDAVVDRAANTAEQQRNQAREAERQQQFERDKPALKSRLKMDDAPAASRPAASTARTQLDCVANESFSGDPRGGNWENAVDCRPVAVAVPVVPVPGAESELAPTEPEQLGRLLSELATRISGKRSEIAEQDREIASQEKIISNEQEPAPVSGLKPAGESDALRRARDALARAKAARAQADRELQELQKQEKESRNAHAP